MIKILAIDLKHLMIIGLFSFTISHWVSFNEILIIASALYSSSYFSYQLFLICCYAHSLT